MIIAVDFDGTIVTHDYPRVGKDIGAIRVLKRLLNRGHHLVLFTMRSGEELAQAMCYLHSFGIDLYGINKNPNQSKWTDSPKAFANLYIDDAGLGMPLKFDGRWSDRPFVDWEKAEEWLISRDILDPERKPVEKEPRQRELFLV